MRDTTIPVKRSFAPNPTLILSRKRMGTMRRRTGMRYFPEEKEKAWEKTVTAKRTG